MDQKTRQDPTRCQEAGAVPYKGAKPVRGRQRARKRTVFIQCLGFALFLACPYLYYAAMVAVKGAWYESAALVLLPLVIFWVAKNLMWFGDKKHAK